MGNKLLLQKGAMGFPHSFSGPRLKLAEWLGEHHVSRPKPASWSCSKVLHEAKCAANKKCLI